MSLDIKKYKHRLEEELKHTVEELEDVGRINPDNPEDWEAVQPDMNVLPQDKNELADTMEEYETDSAVLKELESRFVDIKRALKKIEEGTYGVCEVGGEQISEKRLDANPAARTCLEHQHDLNEG